MKVKKSEGKEEIADFARVEKRSRVEYRVLLY